MQKSTLILLSLLALGACSPTYSTHGNLLTKESIADIQPETSTRADVQDKWGPPSTTSPFDPNTWYYIGETDSQRGIFAPKVDKRQSIKITFNDDDTVKAVEVIDNNLGKDVAIEDRKTPTAGKEYTAFQQFVGNLGKFNPAVDGKKK